MTPKKNTGPHVAVVGAGLAGAAAAIRLAAGGHRVTLCDPNPHVGGKMNVWEAGGYRFDMGPTILTMPAVLERLFESVGRRREDYLELIRLDPQWRCFYADGSRIDLRADPDAMAEELRRVAPADAARYPEFLRYAREMYDISEKYFFWQPYGGLLDMIRDRGLQGGPGLAWKIRPFTSLHQAVSRCFSDPRVVQLFDHFVQYVGSSPFDAPAILSLIPWVQMQQGVWYPPGGTGRVARVLEQLLDEFGVERRLDGVERIELEGGRVSGVLLEGGARLPAAAVVSNCDVIRTYSELLGDPRAAQRVKRDPERFEPACSGVVLYLGCNRTWDHLLHHDFIFSEDPDAEFEDLYRHRRPAEDMTAYLAVPSLTDPTVAPPGHTALYVLVHTPYRTDTEDWEHSGPRYRDAILNRLEARGLTGLRESIQVERLLTPLEIERLYGSTRGSIYGLRTRRGLTAAFKPGNRCSTFPGLYLCGGSVNPGAGVPMVLMSGQIAADCVLADLGSAHSGSAPAGKAAA